MDFAGSGVVYALGGYIALAACILLGPRIGRISPTHTRSQFSLCGDWNFYTLVWI
ncbi:MAG: hypothetical protein DRP01_10635 [Archaeoglobales archaeon]|nr:MAG: hypothetical protein DRP01_10635 [Archaeoglobales archaeon]